VINDFMRLFEPWAPAAYPHVHQVTAPLRASAREAGDPSLLNLWAGQAHPLADELPAAEIVERLRAGAAAAAAALARRLPAE
jgi:nitronate monooxygenase